MPLEKNSGNTSGLTLEAQSLGFAYSDDPVLCDVDLTVVPGKVVGLLGPNGSGKSTLIKVVSGVLPGFTGSVQVEGRRLQDWDRRELAKNMAVVSQEPRFGFPFTALEVVLMGRHPHLGALAYESAEDFTLAQQSLAQCGADHLADRPVTELSSGERQRVVCARALAQQPGIFLLDEPATFMDIKFQIAIYDLVTDLAREKGLSILMVMHDLNLAAEYCDSLYLMKAGRVCHAGSPAAVITEENLAAVFGATLEVMPSPITNRPLVLAISNRTRRRAERKDADKKGKNLI